MKEEDLYEKLKGRIGKIVPGAGDRDERIRAIEALINERKAEIRPQHKAGFTLFGWVEIKPLRWGLVAAAMMLGVFFVVQQTILIRRVNQIETHLDKFSVKSGAAEKQVTSRLVMTGLSMGMVKTDSIMISAKDLERVIREIESDPGSSPEVLGLLRRYARLSGSDAGNNPEKIKL